MLHDTLHAAPIALIPFRQVGKCVQSGLILVIDYLRIPQLLILPGKLIPHLVQFFLKDRLPVIECGNIIIDPQKFFLQLPDPILLLCFIRFGAQKPGVQFGPSYLYLLQHGIKPAHAGFNRSPVIQCGNNGIFPIFYIRIQLIHLRLHSGKFGSRFFSGFLQPGKLGIHSALILQDGLFIPGLCINFLLQVFLPVQQMLFIASDRINLFLQDIDFTFQLSTEHTGIRKLGTFLFDLFIQTLDFCLYPLVLFFNMFIFGCGVRQIAGSDFLFFLHPGKLFPEPGVFQKKNIDIQGFERFLFLQINLCFFRLLFQGLHLFFQFTQYITDTQQILLFILQLPLGGGLPSFKLHNAGGFVKKLSSFFRFSAEDFINLALADDGIAFLADTGIIKKLIHILQSHRRTVHQVFTLPGTVNPPGNGDFIKLDGELVIPVIQCDRHIGIAHGLTDFRTGKYDILHGSAAQLFDALLAQNPADSIRHIAFPAAVWPYNTGDSVMELKRYFIGKGFESVYLYTF